MVKQFAFALGVTTCLASIDLAHSKANNILFSEALEGARSSLRKSISLRTMNSKQQWLLPPQALGRSGVTHGFALGKLRGGLTFPFLRLNRPESPIISRSLLGNLLSASREAHALAIPRRPISLQRLFTAPSTPQRDMTLPFLTSVKTPAPRQFFFGNITGAPITTHAFLAQQNSNLFQKLLTASSPGTPFKSPSASLLSHFRVPETHQLPLIGPGIAPRNTDLVLRNLVQPQASFTTPFVKNIVEEPAISLKEALSPIRTLTNPKSLPSSPEISFASIFKSLISPAISSRVSPQTQSVTSSLREETRERDVASIVSESPSSPSHNERSFVRSPQEDGTQTSFSLTTSTPLEQEERNSHLSVEENSTSLLSDSSLASSPLKKERLDEEQIEKSPSVSSESHFSSQSERQERPEVSFSEQSSASPFSQEHNPMSETHSHPLTKDPLIEPVSLTTNREVAPVISPSEDNEMELQSAMLEDDTAQRSRSEQALEQQRVREQREREEQEKQKRLERERREKLEWAEKEQREWERIEAQHLERKQKRIEEQRLLDEQRLQRENEERLKHEHEREEQERFEQRRREKLEWAQKEQLEWERIEAQHFEGKQKRIEEQRLLDEQRVQRENEERLERERIQVQRLLDEQRVQRENEERLERERIQAQRLLDEQRVQRENQERLERERIQAQRLLDEQRVQRENQEREERELLDGFIVVDEEEHREPENIGQQQPQIPVLHQAPVIINDYQAPPQNDAPPLVVQQQQQQPQARGGLLGWGWGIGGVQLL